MTTPWERRQATQAPAASAAPWEKRKAAAKSPSAEPEQSAPAEQPKPEQGFAGQAYDAIGQAWKSLVGSVAVPARDAQAGVIRGAGSLGATVLLPADMVNQKLRGDDFWSLKDNRQRRADMDAGLQTMGADTDSGLYKTSKIAAEIAGTAGVGGALANGARVFGAPAPVVQGLASGGINVDGATGMTGMLIRGLTGAATGAATAGAINPEDAGLGAAIGGFIPVSAKTAAAFGRWGKDSVKSLVQPLYQSGRDRIVGNSLREFAGGQVDDAVRNLQATRELVPGSAPTVGESAGVPSLAALQRSTMNVSPEAANALEARALSNNQARINLLEEMSSNGGDMAAALAARDSATSAAYRAARGQAAGSFTPSKELTDLAKRPSMQNYIQQAKQLAADHGKTIDNPLESVDGLHYLKLAVDDALQGSPTSALGRNAKSAVMDMKTILKAEMDKISPVYGAARDAYHQASKPINQMQIVDKLLDTVNPATGKLEVSRFARNLNDKTARTATGFKGSTLDNTMSSEQLQNLNNIKLDLIRSNYANNAGRAAGTNTIQNLAYGNMMGQMGIPNFMKQSAAGQTLGGLLAQGGKAIYGGANKQIAEQMAQTMLSPAEAARLMLLQDAPSILLNPIKQGLLGTSKVAPVLSAQ